MFSPSTRGFPLCSSLLQTSRLPRQLPSQLDAGDQEPPSASALVPAAPAAAADAREPPCPYAFILMDISYIVQRQRPSRRRDLQNTSIMATGGTATLPLAAVAVMAAADAKVNSVCIGEHMSDLVKHTGAKLSPTSEACLFFVE